MKLKLTQKGQVVVGLAGVAGAGKNVIADSLGWAQAAFAKALKDDLAPVLRGLGLDMNNREDKAVAREMLVAYGKLARRIDPDFWVKHIELPNEPLVVITDVRYLNEANAIREAGGYVVYVERPGILPANAEEEKSLNDLISETPLDGFVVNDGTIENAADKVRFKVARQMQAQCPVLPLGDGACTYLGDQYSATATRMQDQNFFDHHAITDPIEQFDAAMMQQEADHIHAMDTQRRFNDAASHELIECNKPCRLWPALKRAIVEWWEKN